MMSYRESESHFFGRAGRLGSYVVKKLSCDGSLLWLRDRERSPGDCFVGSAGTLTLRFS